MSGRFVGLSQMHDKDETPGDDCIDPFDQFPVSIVIL